MITFQSLGLSEKILQGILEVGYTTPTPVQIATIPVGKAGRDVIGCAQTGTGKTAAFVLPLLDRLAENRQQSRTRPVRALIVTPTRELALQVEESVRTYGRFTGFRSLAVFGGVPMGPQLHGLRRGADIVVATPGRLLDHLDRGTLDLSQIEILVLDEADRMLDMGFINDIKKIIAVVPRKRQTLLFSATMPDSVLALGRSILTNPEFVEVGERRNPAESVIQQVCAVAQDRKMELLLHVLQNEEVDNVLVFSRTKHRADRIAKKLTQQGFSAAVMHSNRSQGQRQRALDGFKNGRFRILVATDIAARGIDVDSISHVINYDTPNQAEDYIHRIGRTGRAQESGEAITFVAREEEAYLKAIEKHTGQRLTRKVYTDFQSDAATQENDASAAPRQPRGRASHGSGGGRNNPRRAQRN